MGLPRGWLSETGVRYQGQVLLFICGGAVEAVLDSFPVRRFGRVVEGDPVVACGVRLVKLVVEGGSIGWGGGGHHGWR